MVPHSFLTKYSFSQCLWANTWTEEEKEKKNQIDELL